jgi:hypothetical protein
VLVSILHMPSPHENEPSEASCQQTGCLYRMAIEEGG